MNLIQSKNSNQAVLCLITSLVILLSSQQANAQDNRNKKRLKEPVTQTTENVPIQMSKSEIAGLIIDSEGEPLVGAKVFFKEKPNMGTLTDMNGKFILANEPGKYTLSITYVGYQSKEIPIEISKGVLKLIVPISLQEEGVQVETVVIQSTLEKELEVSAVLIQKRSLVMLDVFSSEIILRQSSDLNMATALTRMPGITSIEDKNLIIRGLHERYSLFTLNDIPLPVTQMDRFAFDYNSFPTQSIQSIGMNKSANATHFSTASSAWVNIETPVIPDRNEVKVTSSFIYNDLASFRRVNHYKTNGGFLGQVQAPKNIMEEAQLNALDPSSETMTQETRKIPENNQPQTPFYTLGQRYTTQIKQRWQKGTNVFGLYATLDAFSNTSVEHKIIATTGAFDPSIGRTSINDLGTYVSTNKKEALNGIINLGWKHKDKLDLEFLNYLSSSTFNSYNINRGQMYSMNITASVDPYIYIPQSFVYTNLIINQLRANYHISKQTHIHWSLFHNSSQTTLPLDRADTFYENNGDGKFYYYPYTPSDIDPYSYLTTAQQKERQLGIRAEIEHNIGKKTTLTFGLMAVNTSKNFNSRSFSLISDSTFNISEEVLDYDNYPRILVHENMRPGGLYLHDNSDFSNRYHGMQQLIAAYGQGKWNATDIITLSGGLRVEYFNQTMIHPGTPYGVIHNSVSLLPNLTCKITPTERLNLKASIFRSTARPELREIAQYGYWDNTEGFLWLGNPRLQSAYITNVEGRIEYFPSGKDLVSFAIFYKHFKNPFEQYLSLSAENVVQVLSIRNAGMANVTGAEVEVRKNLGFIHENLTNFSLYGNFSLLRSRVDVNLFKEGKPLQGQANRVVNTGLIYKVPKINMQFSSFFSHIGRLISIVGTTADEYPDFYQMPRSTLDFQVSQQIGRFEWKLVLIDVINQPYRRDQLYDVAKTKGSKATMAYINQKGFKSMLSLSYTF